MQPLRVFSTNQSYPEELSDEGNRKMFPVEVVAMKNGNVGETEVGDIDGDGEDDLEIGTISVTRTIRDRWSGQGS